MSEFEKIQFEAVGYNPSANEFGVYFDVEENHLLIEFEEKLRESDYVFVERREAEAMFDKRSKFEGFARERVFSTRWSHRVYCFICEKEPPWTD